MRWGFRLLPDDSERPLYSESLSYGVSEGMTRFFFSPEGVIAVWGGDPNSPLEPFGNVAGNIRTSEEGVAGGQGLLGRNTPRFGKCPDVV